MTKRSTPSLVGPNNRFLRNELTQASEKCYDGYGKEKKCDDKPDDEYPGKISHLKHFLACEKLWKLANTTAEKCYDHHGKEVDCKGKDDDSKSTTLQIWNPDGIAFLFL